MKRGIVLILVALLLLGAGCTQTPTIEETTAGVTETTVGDTLTEDETQGTSSDVPAEQSPVIDSTEPTQPTQNNEDQDPMQDSRSR